MNHDWQVILSAEPLDPTSLREAVRSALLTSGAVSSVEAVSEDPMRLEVRSLSGTVFRTSVRELLAEASGTPAADRAAVLARHLASAVDMARELDESSAPGLGDLVSVVRGVGWVRDALTASPDLAHEALVADLEVVYAFDRPNSLVFATNAQLAGLGASGASLRERAVANLRARLPRELTKRGDPRTFMLVAGGNFESSLLLLDEVWDEIGRSLSGSLIVCAPARDLCLVTSTAIEGGLLRLLSARDHICADGPPAHFVSTTVLRRDGTRWVPFQLPS